MTVKVVDRLLAPVLLLAGVVGTAPASRNLGLIASSWWMYVPVVLAALAVLVRWRFPVAVLGVSVAAVCAYMLMGLLYGPILFSLAVALYAVAAHRPLRVAATAAAVIAVLMVVCGMIGTGFGLAVVTPVTAWAVGPLAVGVTVRVTREQRLQNRRDELRRHADAERLRVAQEVHDVVGHGLAAITMQAEIALHVLAKNKARTAPPLTAPSPTAPPLTAPYPTAPSSTAPSPTAPSSTAPSPTAPSSTAPSPTAPSSAAPGATPAAAESPSRSRDEAAPTAAPTRDEAPTRTRDEAALAAPAPTRDEAPTRTRDEAALATAAPTRDEAPTRTRDEAAARTRDAAALAAAEAALGAISRASRESLDELRVTLGAVRRGSEEFDDRAPAPGLARLDALVDRTRAAGVPVSLSVSGELSGLPTAVDLAAYRVVQESLTNVLRHAGSATADVRLEASGDRLVITVVDTGRGGDPSVDNGGHGLVGMRERVTALGGTLTAGAYTSGGFEVKATIPVPRRRAADG